MAKQRYIKDSFWTDPYIEKLSPEYKLVFLYLLTNPLSNIAGVYEIRIKRMAYETGYDIEVIENIVKKFVDDKKIIQVGDWIIMVNHIKHQSLGNLTAEGINRVIKESPLEVQEFFNEVTMTNSKNEEYSVLALKDSYKPLISPLIAPTRGALSRVKLGNVTLVSENFEKFWEEYPRKIAKKEASKAFNRVKTELSVILAGLAKWKQSDQWTKDNGQFIPHPTTWLNQERWNDEVPKGKSTNLLKPNSNKYDGFK